MRSKAPNLRLAVLLSTGSSLMVPVIGLVNAPLLARALSPEGRGEVAAAMAPAVLMLAVATLGLPEALTYHLAKRPQVTRRALAWASAITLLLGACCVAATWLVGPYLSGGDTGLAELMVLAGLITLPGLVVNLLRGAASGHQFYVRVAADRVVVSLWRLGWFVALFATGELTVLTAILVTATAPLVGGVAYLPLIWSRFEPAAEDDEHGGRVVGPLLGFGSQIWFGAVAMMLLARTSDLFMVPLASSEDLGLYVVAITVADVPILVSFAIQSALFGVNSKRRDAAQAAMTCRMTILVGTIGCGAMAAALPFALVPLFGAEFADALVPSLLILARAVYGIPGLLAGGSLAAWGRPGLRSAGLVVSFAVNVTGFFVLVPLLGLYGAVVAGFVTATVTNVFMLVAARRVMGVRGVDFWLVGPRDVARLWREGRSATGHVLARLPRPGR